MHIFLIRHGESIANVGDNYVKRLPDHLVPLTEEGIRQAKENGVWLAQYCKEKGIDLSKARIWRSPFLRTRQTCDAFNESLGLAQAEALEAKGVRIDHVVSIELSDDVIESRMTGRRVCTKCGASYHIIANPPKAEGICDQCGAEVATRKDDAPETVRHRLQVYHDATEVLKDYYCQRGKLRLVEGNQSIEAANQAILAAIGVTL